MLHSNSTLTKLPYERKEPVPLASGTLLRHYEIRSKIGAGGMGEVYLASDTKLGRDVALKLLPEEFAHDRYRMQRFIREAQAASAINHPNVCVIHEVGETEDGRSFIAMEYVEGESLSAKIAGKPLAPKEIVDIGMQVADGLSEAHAKGIIHRDIKPSNIAITPRGQAKILDFGLARISPSSRQIPTGDRSTQVKTETGILLGTVDYMSPEQALGRELDARSDIFSLGVVLFEMATGRRPFSSKNPLETIDRIAHAEPEPITTLNPKMPCRAAEHRLEVPGEGPQATLPVGQRTDAGTRNPGNPEGGGSAETPSPADDGSRLLQRLVSFAFDTLDAAGDFRMVGPASF